ncbi:M56 family metallopeptidase [Mucilaginibacter phyllosphaerae]|uniref:M56 family metallopeptidase n=1 Tax=Mucilaginibacter phyllosphaerae TaxID=1812349 RepID=A0A4Y8A8J5_9SPHI|nr:M56 family metallopeptidase [Mucilaginibacter phyllosphaerae]MBB3970881.1 hypothetical protein [Mucilaginibacter phyllosphaerae]TEW64184.1 M56 family metallopeptidase [Mucilaginibacter phyllosphaerae]GGH05194.1 hypothetical protein GCM10007352_08830 [Mucilaginibacter phyllosphaerae]
MPALFVFLLKVNIALLLFCAGYYLVLRHLTFYTLNRAYLVAAIIFATLYPKIDLSDFAQRHETLAKPVQNVILNWQAPAVSLIKPLAQPNYWQWATAIFWFGAALLGVRLLMQLFSLFMLYRRSWPARIHEHDVRIIEGEVAPFSFWRNIYVNPANHTPADLKAILLHEQVHVNGWHTIDILLAELSSIFYWFNPGIWLMKKAVRENIEFITDRKILTKGFDSKTYQYSLVNVSFNTSTPGIVNHFNISTIKKRIIMMNAKRSSKFTLTRYAFVVPAVIALLLVFTLSKADIAKPITHKIAIAIKPVTLALKIAAQNAVTFSDTVPSEKVKPATKPVYTDTFKQKSVQPFTIKLDTLKKQAFSFSFDKNHSLDSMDIILNSKKITKNELNALDPSTIASVNIMSVDDVKNKLNLNYGSSSPNSDKVVFITTKGSGVGQALANQLGTNNQLTNIRINGVNKATKNLTEKELAIINALPGTKGSVNNVVITGYSSASTTPANQIREVVLDSGTVIVNGVKSSVVSRMGAQIRNNAGNGNVIALSSTNSNNAVAVKGYRTNASFVYDINTTNVNRISDKLIMIDGKVASEKEMKKLSAFDIDRMSVSNSADTVKKYGDKAKYGVVYIYTKKGK